MRETTNALAAIAATAIQKMTRLRRSVVLTLAGGAKKSTAGDGTKESPVDAKSLAASVTHGASSTGVSFLDRTLPFFRRAITSHTFCGRCAGSLAKHAAIVSSH